MSENNTANIVAFAQALCAASDYRSLLSAISQELARNLPAENVLVWLYDEAHQQLLCESSKLTTLDSGLVRESIRSEAGVHGEVSSSNVVRMVENARADANSSMVEGVTLRSVILVPLRDHAHDVGVIEAINQQGRR